MTYFRLETSLEPDDFHGVIVFMTIGMVIAFYFSSMVSDESPNCPTGQESHYAACVARNIYRSDRRQRADGLPS
jgi:hypothetical protein